MLHFLYYYDLVPPVIDCGPPPSPANASPATIVTATIFGVDVTYVCDSGYLPEGEATITCEGSGSWSGQGPQCNGVFSIKLHKHSLHMKSFCVSHSEVVRLVAIILLMSRHRCSSKTS